MNKQLFEAFYAKNFKKLVRWIRHSHISKEDAKDLAQEIFLELFEKYDDIYILENEGYFWKYLVRNRINDFLSKKEE